MRPCPCVEYSETQPIQYEQNLANFMGMDIYVDERVFIPRPETELLVKTVAEMVSLKKSGDEKYLFLEIGTGSGIIPICISKLLPESRIISVDVSRDALSVAKRNIERLVPDSDITLFYSDIFSAVGDIYFEKFDAIISNPPYVSSKDYEKLDAWVKSEPKIALWGGVDGLDYYKKIAENGMKFLKKGGLVGVEVGYDQGLAVKKIFNENSFSNVKSFRDFNNFDRIVIGWKHG
ncbi:N5-glutamine S-adenosyl-L-methionine-dependent methyltransferase [Candidatus Omnitrophus magneticus]|uniref:peptide chain release factor N(5)-glutamine methyltransferase n=1 Tax=Candidatus Omnitrophus magneticus TaxID=1609969 RepID=A0A0F0CIW5_9BACT|nr:N5-glutamine S-adenosyl-L-methionine-dependent methyltransferase [Candidatus Omnitrophus magneticus]